MPTIRLVWELQLKNSTDEENSFDGNEDPYLPYGDSYKCSSTLHKILEEIQNCQKNLFLIQEKDPEVFELVQEYFQDIFKIIDYENSISHHLEDHEIYDEGCQSLISAHRAGKSCGNSLIGRV